eukprot:COSAG05_NODE_3644_length_1936_cov_2.143168_1_plen_250_part_00
MQTAQQRIPLAASRRVDALARHFVAADRQIAGSSVAAAAGASSSSNVVEPPLAPGPPASAVFSGKPCLEARRHLEEYGYVIVDSAVNPDLLPMLLAAARRVAPRVRAGELNSRMLTPLDGEPIFAEYYASSELVDWVQYFIERPLEQLSLSEFCLFSHPADGLANNQGWHRDATWWQETSGSHSKGRAHDRLNPASYDVSIERQIWEAGQWDRRPSSPRHIAKRGGVGFHLALVEDDCFEVVPGSVRDH